MMAADQKTLTGAAAAFLRCDVETLGAAGSGSSATPGATVGERHERIGNDAVDDDA